MGIAITELLSKKEIKLEELNNKTIAVDASNWIYQFLTTIRQRDGTPLMDSKGNITSHLTGIFTRTAKLIKNNIKLIYVFDGKIPEFKHQEVQRRKELKVEAEKKYLEALQKRDVEEMRKYASRTAVLTKDMVKETKELISAFGQPIIQAPSEAEAQASYIVKKEKAFAVASQDADCLLYQCPRLIRNLSIVGRRKKVNKLSYETIKPEILTLTDTLNNLGIDQEQLIILSILVGTDYNPGGIKGIGPKNALKLVKKIKEFDMLFEQVKWGDYFAFPWTDIFYLIKKMPVEEDFKLNFRGIDEEKIKEILIEMHDFSEERVNNILKPLVKEKSKKQQKGLGDFF
jgi:flap endonuclease-1